jgi:hypothetical protein
VTDAITVKTSLADSWQKSAVKSVVILQNRIRAAGNPKQNTATSGAVGVPKPGIIIYSAV